MQMALSTPKRPVYHSRFIRHDVNAGMRNVRLVTRTNAVWERTSTDRSISLMSPTTPRMPVDTEPAFGYIVWLAGLQDFAALRVMNSFNAIDALGRVDLE